MRLVLLPTQIPPPPGEEEEYENDAALSEEVLELDDVTRHPCMQTILLVVDEFNAKKLPPTKNEVWDTIPITV